MVLKENAQRYKYGNNSLLQSATTKRLGAARFGKLIGRGVNKAPIKKLKIQRSDESRVSDLTGSIVEEARPAMIREVQAQDIDVESSILEMSLASGNSIDFSASKVFAKDLPLVGEARETKPQPAPFMTKNVPTTAAAKSKAMEIQPGLRITAPSPMSLDRIQVQSGQEHAAPPSQEYIRGLQEKREAMEMEEKKREYMEKKAEEKSELKKKLKEELQNELKMEHEEGFEAQLEGFQEALSPPRSPKKKSLVKKILNKLRPPKKNRPPTAEEARRMAREAMAKSRRKVNNGQVKDLPVAPSNLPVGEINMAKREDSVSDLDSSARKMFPVREILMGDGAQERDDQETISTLGTQHVLEKLLSGPLRGQTLPELREPNLRNLVPRKTDALIDQIDSGTLTEDAEAQNTMGHCGQPRGPKGSSRMCDAGPLNYALAAFCVQPQVDDEAQYTKDMKAGVVEEMKRAANGKVLSPIDETNCLSPKSIPALEGDDQENKDTNRNQTTRNGGDGIIDLTNLASPKSPVTDSGVKGDKKKSIFSFDDIMDIAASKLQFRSDDDRYAVEGDESPRKIIAGKHVTGKSANIPVVQGVEVTKARGSLNEVTPRASGAQRRAAELDPDGDVATNGSTQSKVVYEHPEGDVVMWSSVGSAPELLESPINSPVQSPTKARNDSLLDSQIESPISSPNGKRSSSGFANYVSDGLFDLLSTDESVSRGRKKVPFLSNSMPSNDEEGRGEVTKQPGIDPSLGVMCGAVPLYFMYQNENEGGQQTRRVSKTTTMREQAQTSVDAIMRSAQYHESAPELPEFENLQQTGKQEPAEKEDLIHVDSTDAPKEKGTAVNESAAKIIVLEPQEEDQPGVDNEPEGNKMLPQQPSAFEHQPRSNEQSRDAPLVDKEGVLLERDDAYWDTLSTIASTKGKSLDSAKNFEGQDLLAGPIPEEITMTNKKDTDVAPVDQQVQQPAVEMKKAMGHLTNLIEDEKSNGSLSQKLAALDVSHNVASTQKAASPRNSQDVTLARAGGASVGDSIAEPPSHTDVTEEDKKLREDKVTGFVSQLEKISRDTKSLFVYQPASLDEGDRSRKDDMSDDTSGLLLAVTRSEGDDRSRSQRSGVLNAWKETRRTADGKEEKTSAWQGLEPYLSLTPGMETLNNIIGGDELELKPKKSNNSPRKSSPKKSRTQAAGVPKVPSSRDKPAPVSGIMSAPSPVHGVFNSWRNPTRSVSWGFEEIYEAPEPVDSPTSAKSLEEEYPVATAVMSGLAAAAAAAATAMAQATSEAPVSTEATVTTGTESKQLSDEDEHELISRTLQLSKQLLASMTAQDLEGADNEVVKSLLSFGTDDSAARSSLPELDSKPAKEIIVEQITPKVSSTMEASTMEDTAVVEETPPLGASFIPVSVNVDTNKAPGGRNVPKAGSATMPVIDLTPSSFQPGPVIIDAELESMKGSPAQPSTSVSASASASASGQSEHSPIDVEGMLNQYEDLAHKLLDENMELKSMAHQSAAPSDTAIKGPVVVPAAAPSPTRLDALRAQRAAALNKFNGIHSSFERTNGVEAVAPPPRQPTLEMEDPSSSEPSTDNAVASPMSSTTAGTPMAAKRNRDRLANYGRTARAAGTAAVPSPSSAAATDGRPTSLAQDLEDASTTSSTRSTASMKARELRIQLEDALKASKNIRESQEQLGSELRDFKDKFYKKNDALEDQAKRAIAGLPSPRIEAEEEQQQPAQAEEKQEEEEV